MIVINLIFSGIFCVTFPFLIGSILYRESPFSTSSWITGIFFISYLILIAKGLNLEIIYLKGFFVILSLLLIKNFLLKLYKLNAVFSPLKINKKFDLYIFIFFSMIFLILFEGILEVIRYPISAGDALAYWLFKTRAYMEWVPFSSFPTISYPSLGSAIWAYILYFFKLEFFGRIFFIIIYSVFIFNFASTILKSFSFDIKFNRIFYLLISMIFIFGLTEEFGGNYKFLYSGYMDWLVTLLVCFSYFILLTKLTEDISLGNFNLNINKAFLPFFLIGCAGLVKEEGIFYGLISLLCYLSIIVIYYKNYFIKNIYKLISLSMLTIVISLTYKFILVFNNLSLENAQGYTIKSIIDNLSDRLFDIQHISKIIDGLILMIMYNYEIIIPTLIVTLYTIKNGYFKPITFVFLPILLSILFIMFVFLVTNYTIDWHIATALNRLFYFPITLCLFGSVFLLAFNFHKLSNY